MLASHLQPYPRIRLEIKKPSWMPRRASERGHHHETAAVLQIQDGYRPLASRPAPGRRKQKDRRSAHLSHRPPAANAAQPHIQCEESTHE
jgi:hypothetical protein